MITYKLTDCKDVAGIYYNGVHIGFLTKKKGNYRYSIQGEERVIDSKYKNILNKLIQREYEFNARLQNEIIRKPFTLSLKRLGIKL